MLLLGIDIAKLNHVASLVSSGELIFSNFKFQNNMLGFLGLLEKISKFSINEIVIGLESTGHYGENFSSKKVLKLLLSILYKLHICAKQILETLKM